MSTAVICTAAALTACGVSEDDGDIVTNPNVNRDAGMVVNEFADAAPPQICSKMDILFVIDDSGSMGEEQANLQQNFPRFIELLNSFQAGGGLLDYRVAVTTTGRDYNIVLPIPLPFPLPPTPGDNGAFRRSCGMTERWIDRDEGDVAQTFACVANVGTSGPGLEMPLYAIQLAFGERIEDGTNTGFLREDALLAIVILTDEDDCSRSDDNFEISLNECADSNAGYIPPAATVEFLDNLTGDRSRWAAAVIAGPTACSSAFGDAEAADNLADFVSQTGDNAIFSSICEGDLTLALEEALSTFDTACQMFPPVL